MLIIYIYALDVFECIIGELKFGTAWNEKIQ